MSITYTYESNMIYLHTLKVHCTIDITWVEHSCEIDEVFYIVYFPSIVLDVYYLQLWKQYDLFVHIKSSLYYRYNLSRTHFGRLIRNLYIVHFHSTVLDVYYLHLWKQYDVFVHIKSSLYYRYNLSRTHFARLIRNLCTVHFHSTILDVYYLHLWKQYDVFVHIKSSL